MKFLHKQPVLRRNNPVRLIFLSCPVLRGYYVCTVLTKIRENFPASTGGGMNPFLPARKGLLLLQNYIRMLSYTYVESAAAVRQEGGPYGGA